MTNAPSDRLLELSRRYNASGGEPAGESFHRAFARYMRANRESLFDITLAVTSAPLTLDAGPHDVDPLLLKAVYDTNPSLTETHFFGMDEVAQQGAVNAAKGKYFEYLVVERLNAGEQVGPLVLPDGFHAELAESFTQPGWDLHIIDEHGATAEYLQLKATDSVGYVRDALERYPDFQILATHDVADSGLVIDSGFSNVDLAHHVGTAVDAADASVSEMFIDYFSPLIPLVAIASWEGYKVVVGRQSIDAFKMSLARRGQRVVVAKLAGAVVYALDGGLFSIPAAFAGGLWFDHTINRTAIASSFREHRSRLLALRLQQQDRVLNLGLS
ncbi:MAG: hypothetical protein KAX88_01945 [Rhodoferax sp.]|jgi:hypothetical protein|nr:hypothetical protein [Rhodoferax sp.]MBP9058683.1 hypothetical protein [Rhodoferax sp.]